MVYRTEGKPRFERLRARSADTDKTRPGYGFVDGEENGASVTDAHLLVYRHACPNCAGGSEHVFEAGE